MYMLQWDMHVGLCIMYMYMPVVCAWYAHICQVPNPIASIITSRAMLSSSNLVYIGPRGVSGRTCVCVCVCVCACGVCMCAYYRTVMYCHDVFTHHTRVSVVIYFKNYLLPSVNSSLCKELTYIGMNWKIYLKVLSPTLHLSLSLSLSLSPFCLLFIVIDGLKLCNQISDHSSE